MIEIIVAIILQITTILGGGDAEKAKAEQQEKVKTEKAKDNINNSEGGSGTWDG